jgi:DNA polymerase-3 subunit epsilon
MYAIVDIETTGGSASNSAITEIAIHVHDGGKKLIQHFTTLINPESSVPDFITALTGTSNAMVASAPVLMRWLIKFYKLLSSDNIFIAHNVTNFTRLFTII